MGIQRSQEDSWTKEMRKHEMRPVLVNGTYVEPLPMSAGGKGDMPFQVYPKMLYKAESADGGPRICAWLIVDTEDRQRAEESRGWCDGQEVALARVASQQLEFAKLAANRAHNDRWMSDGARSEAQAIDEATMAHLPSIPETAIKPHGTRLTITETAIKPSAKEK